MASAFHHDHLFVEAGEEDRVMGLLSQLSQSVNDSSDEDIKDDDDLVVGSDLSDDD